LTSFNGQLLFSGSFGGGTIATSDGTEDGTKLITVPGQIWRLGKFTSCSGSIYFIARDFYNTSSDQIWKTDGTVAGTMPVSVFPSGDGVQMEDLIGADDRLYFVGVDSDHGPELWVADESEIGAHIVKELTRGSQEAYLFKLSRLKLNR
jgi:ELWxxDGT repeat protein